jgi:hypothetical protein
MFCLSPISKVQKMPINLAGLFHPQIRAAIEAAIPSDWTARFVEENSLRANNGNGRRIGHDPAQLGVDARFSEEGNIVVWSRR